MDIKGKMNEAIVWLTDRIRKHGPWVVVLIVLWYSLKRMWYWVFMPLLFLVFLKQLSMIVGLKWVDGVSVVYLVASWVFVLSLLRGVFGLVFEVKYDKD